MCVSVQQPEHTFSPPALPPLAPDASQYCSCSPLDSKRCRMRARKQISASVFWPPSGKQEQRRHVRNSELNSDLNLENKGRALWGRTMKLWIHNFKSPCWRQALWTRLNISNAHQLPFQKVIFCCGFCSLGGFWAERQYETLGEDFFFFSGRWSESVPCRQGPSAIFPSWVVHFGLSLMLILPFMTKMQQNWSESDCEKRWPRGKSDAHATAASPPPSKVVFCFHSQSFRASPELGLACAMGHSCWTSVTRDAYKPHMVLLPSLPISKTPRPLECHVPYTGRGATPGHAQLPAFAVCCSADRLRFLG